MQRNQDKENMRFMSPTFGTGSRPNVNEAQPKTVHLGGTKKKLKLILLALIVLVVVIAGLFGWTFYSIASRLTGESNPYTILRTILPQPVKLSNGRVNILLAGYSADSLHHQGADLTDSIMIISINPKSSQAVMISVPRDLWVNIPGNGYSKINAAYEDGLWQKFQQPGYFNGGMGLLQQVIEHDFGIKLDYYALINYAAIKDGVNAIGGITINIQSPDPRGIYDPYTHIKLPNGPNKLNGQEALDLARTRGDGPGAYGIPNADFTRTQYQQEMLLALKEKAASASSILDPLTVVRLANAVGNNVQTDLNIGQLETLNGYVHKIHKQNVRQITLNNYNGQDLLMNYYTPNGQDALIPAAGFDQYSAISNVLRQLLGVQ